MGTQVSTLIQKLCKITGSNYISTKPMQDRTTGKIRANVTHGIHYTELGVKVLAKETKKSLYSTANRTSTQLETINNKQAKTTQTATKLSPTTTATATTETAGTIKGAPTI